MEKATGAIYWEATDRRGLSPLELVRRATSLHADLFRPALARVEKLDRTVTEKIVSRIPDDWMTPLAREFAVELMCYSVAELRKVTS